MSLKGLAQGTTATPSGAAGGDLAGTYPNPTIAAVNANVGTFGSATQVSQVTVNAKGQVTAVQNVTITPPLRPPTRQTFTSGTAQTYTTPAGVSYIKITMAGGGGGGGGGGTTSTGGAGGNGGNSTFSGGTLTAGGGVGGSVSGSGGSAGGTGTNGLPNYTGGPGNGSLSSIVGLFLPGPLGGTTQLFANASSVAVANTGAGGGGGFANGAANTGCSGSGAGCVEFTIGAPAATYTYSIGAGGTAGTAGTNGGVGQAGAAGILIVDEF